MKQEKNLFDLLSGKSNTNEGESTDGESTVVFSETPSGTNSTLPENKKITHKSKRDSSSDDDDDDQKASDDGDDEDEEGKKKPKDGDTSDGEVTTVGDTDDTGTETSSRKLLSSIRKGMKKMAKNVAGFSAEDYASGSNAYDALKALAKEVNSLSRRPMIADVGSVQLFNKALSLNVAMISRFIQSISTNYDINQATPDSLQILAQIKDTISSILNAVSTSDTVALMLNSRNLWRHLFCANVMINGAPALVNGDAEGQQTDLWLFYQLFTDSEADLTGTTVLARACHDRDGNGDNSLEPDLTIIKPMFAIFPCVELKRKLMSLNINANLIGDYDDDADLGLLGAYSIPTCFGGNSNADPTPDEEDRTIEGLFNGRCAVGDNDTPALNAPEFTWSHNGTDRIRQKAISKYARANDEFIKEIKDMHDTAVAKHMVEFDINVCFCIVLTGYLNAIFRVLCEANMIGTKQAVEVGQKMNEDRFIATTNEDLLFKWISDIPVGNTRPDGSSDNLFSSIINMVKQGADSLVSRQLAPRFHYSEVCYQRLRKEFVAMTYKAKGDTEFSVGATTIGNHQIKINVVPKLYLPVDVSREINDAEIEINYPRPSAFGQLRPVIDNPFSFAIQCNRTKFVATRNVNENNYIINISILHTICSMTNETYSAFIEHFYDMSANTYVIGNDNRERLLRDLFAHPTEDHANGAQYTRLFSAIAPFYQKNSILGLRPLDLTQIKTDHNYLAYPMLDKLLRFNAGGNTDYDLANDYHSFHIGDYVRSIFNIHGDWSWVEAMIVCSVMCSCYMDLVAPATFDDDTHPYHFQTVHFYLDAGDNPNARMAVSTAFRRAVNYMDDKSYGLQFYRIKDGICASDYPKSSSTLVTKQDYINAFRYVKYDRTSPYLVDTLYGKQFATRKYWLCRSGGNVTAVRRLMPEKTAINITEEEFIKDTFNPDNLIGNFLIYDFYHEAGAQLTICPEVILGTGLVGYRFNSVAARNRVSQSFATAAKVYDKLHLNDYCYIKDDFFPTEVIYTLEVPTNTMQNRQAFNNVCAYSNIKSFEIAINIIHRAGLDVGNPAGVRLLLQIAMGVNANVNTLQLVHDEETYHNGEVVGYGYRVNYAEDLDASPDEAESFNTTFRYASTVTMPAVGYLTGLPKHINEGSLLSDMAVASMKRAAHFYSLFGGIIENNRSDVQTHHQNDSEPRYTFFTLRGGMNNEFNDDTWNIHLTLTQIQIIQALAMEDK